MNNKILTAIFLVLFIVLLAEVGYLVFSNKPKGISAPNTNKEISAPNTNKAYIQADTENSEYLAQLFKKTLTFQEKEFYRNIFSLNYPKSQYSSFILETKLNGQVVNIDTGPGQFHPLSTYGYKFDLKMENRLENLTIYYPKEDLSKVTGLNEMMKNDSVTVNETYDLREFKLIKAEITKN